MEGLSEDSLKPVPNELKALKQWVTWQYIDRDGELSKFPSRGGGVGASSSDPKTWTTFENAVYFSRIIDRVEGVGFMFSAGDPYCGVDLDGCRNAEDGTLAEWAAEILGHFNTYCEISPSGTGVKLIFRAKSPFSKGKNRKLESVDKVSSKTPGIEIYDHLRFWTFTGDILPGKPNTANDCQEALNWLCERYKDVLAETSENHDDDNEIWFSSHPTVPDDMRILEMAYGSANGDKIRSLFGGVHNGYPSASEADMALASMLVFWTGPDLSRLMSLMRQSGLARTKWNKMHGDATYLETTCRKAISSTSTFFPWDQDQFKGTNFNFVKSNKPPHSASTSDPDPVEQPYKPEKPVGRRIEVIHAREFSKHDYHPQWLVKRVLVAGQPAICGGRSKAMKTSNMVDLAVSIGTGTPFLGHFETARQTVTILSGESGAFTIQETAQRVARDRSVDLASADVYFGFNLPQISRGPDILATIDMINETGSKVLIIDPAYLCLTVGAGAKQTTNVFDMGCLLAQLTLIVDRTQATVILCHHCRKSPGEGRDRNDPPDLEELSMAGFAEWARQWILIGRREPFEPGSGLHKLWLNVGGSVGFSGTWSVDIDEGVLLDDFSGRTWSVKVGTREDAKTQRDSQREKQEAKKQERLEWSHQRKVIAALRLEPAGMTRNQLRDATGMNSKALASAIITLRQRQDIRTSPGTVRGKECELFLLTDSAPKTDEQDEPARDFSNDFDDFK